MSSFVYLFKIYFLIPYQYSLINKFQWQIIILNFSFHFNFHFSLRICGWVEQQFLD